MNDEGLAWGAGQFLPAPAFFLRAAPTLLFFSSGSGYFFFSSSGSGSSGLISGYEFDVFDVKKK